MVTRDLVLRWAPIPGTAQEAFFDDDLQDGTLLLAGGWGSGKTMTLTAKMLKLSAINAPLPGIWCVPDYNHIHDTILPTLLDRDPDTGRSWFLREDQCEYHGQQGQHGPAHCLRWDGGGPIWFVTAENVRSIAGPNVAFCGTDEPGSIPHAAWRNAIARVRHPRAPLRQKVASGTPEGLNFLAEQFGPDMAAGYRKYTMPTRENTELLRHHPGYLDQVRANATEAELASYLDGQFVNMTGALAYSAFRAEHQMRTTVAMDPALPLRVSFDFNVDPMTMVIGQQWPGIAGLEFSVVAAVALMASTVVDVCADLVQRYPRWPAGVMIYGDATGRARSQQSLRSNYDIIREALAIMGTVTLCVPMANPAVTLRLNSVNRLCCDGHGRTRLWLLGDAQRPRESPTRELVRSLQQTVKKAGTHDVWKKPGETVTHLGDALGYWVTAEAPAVPPPAVVAAIKAPSHTAPMSQTMQAIRARKSARLAQDLAHV